MQFKIGKKTFSFSLYTFAVHPLLKLTIAFMVGIFCRSFSSSVLLIPLLLGLACGIFFLKKWQMIFVYILFFALGVLRYELCEINKLALDHYFEQGKVSIVGKIKDIEYSDHKNYSMIITLTVHAINNVATQNSTFFDKNIKLFTGRTENVRPGDILNLVSISLKMPQGPYALYAWRDGVFGTAFIKKSSLVVCNRPTISIIRYIIEKRNALLNVLKQRMSPRTFSFFSSLFLGNKLYYESELSTVKEEFKLWGLSHYLARSGLHLVLFVIIWELLLKLLPIPWFFKQYILLFFVLVYWLLSWMSVSFLRAFITFIFYKAYSLLLFPINGLHLLSLVTFLVLVLNPLHLFFLDFQLSFGLTFALIWFNAITHARKQAV